MSTTPTLESVLTIQDPNFETFVGKGIIQPCASSPLSPFPISRKRDLVNMWN